MRPSLFLTTLLVASALAITHAAPAFACDDDDCEGDDHDHEHSHEHDHDHGSGKLDETHAAKPNGKVDVNLFSGSLRIGGWAQNFVRVRGDIDDDCKVDVTSLGERTEIGVHCMHGPPEADLEIMVPQGSAIEAGGMSAEIAVHDVNGALQLRSVTADVVVSGGAPREIEATSTSGSIGIDANAARVEARSVSGDVRVTGVHGHASLHSVSGTCVLSGGTFDDVSIESVSGDVVIDGALASNARAEVHTHSGEVSAKLPNASNVDIELKSFSGELTIDMAGQKSTASSNGHGMRTVTLRLGTGGAKLVAHSFSGDVTIKGK